MSTIVAGDRPTEKPSTSFTHTNANMVLILEIAGAAEVLPVGNQDWETAKVKGLLKEGDRFRTKTNSRATLRLSDLSQLRVGEMTEIEVKRVSASEAPPLYKLWKGVIYFFHRERPGRFQFESPNASAAVRGTEFALRVENLPPGVLTILTVLDGEVDLSNPDGQAGVRVGSGEQGIVQPGQNPSVTAMVQAEIRDSVQWVLYYPAVVAVEELRLSAEEETALSLSLEAYKTGDLLRALAGYPMERIGVSAREQVYRAGLLLAVGQVEVALELLDAVDAGDPQQGDPLTVRPVHRLGRALRELVATVKGESAAVTAKEVNVAPILATELLVESYVRQSRLDLSGALKAARQL